MSQITPEVVAAHSITPDEYERVVSILGREPNITELGIFSVMWSEHCSYKSSRVHLKKLPTKSKLVVCGPGENAGIMDIGKDAEGKDVYKRQPSPCPDRDAESSAGRAQTSDPSCRSRGSA